MLLILLLTAVASAQYQQQRYNQGGYPQQQYGQQQYGQQQQNQQQMQQQQRYSPQQSSQQNQFGQQQQYGQQPQQQTQGGQNGLAAAGSNPALKTNGRTAVINNPVKLATTNSSTGGARVDLQLTGYTNANFDLSANTTCKCPIAYCKFLEAGQQNACSFSFVTVISSNHQSVQYVQSEFYPFSGQLTTGEWTNLIQVYMPSKPVAIDVFVQHMGVTIDKTSAAALSPEKHLSLVDTFVVDMSKIVPGPDGQQPQMQNMNLQGTMLHTGLNLRVGVSCANGMTGPNCDLNCNTTSTGDSVVCQNEEGQLYSCKRSGTMFTQCSACVHGTAHDGTCTPEGYALPIAEAGVSTAFRTWTIVLGVLLGLAVLFIALLICTFIILRNRGREEQEQAPAVYKSPQYQNGASNPSRQRLIDDEWAPAAPRRQYPEDATRNSEDSYRPNQQRQEHQV